MSYEFKDIEAKDLKETGAHWDYDCFVVIGALTVITVLLCLSYFVIFVRKVGRPRVELGSFTLCRRFLGEMVTTKVTNRCEVLIEIKEGNVGVCAIVGRVKPGSSLRLTVSELATYREYWCAAKANDTGEKVLLTSGDCMEFKEGEIYIDEYGKLAWKPVRKRK